MRYLIIITVAMSAIGCGSPKGTSMEFSKACDPANEKQYIEVPGTLADRGSVFCSNTSGRLECGFDLLEAAGSDKKLRVDIEEGSGANTVTKLERGYKKDDIKIRDNTGLPVVLDRDTVKLTGKMSIAPPAPGGQGVCFMQVTKIER
jgi:hypothetical protein